MAHILQTSVHGNPNVGLYAFCNDKFCLLGKEVSDSDAKEIEKVLKVPVHRITIAGTSLIGVFVAGNNKIVLLPEIVFERELLKLDELGIKYQIINTKLTALGNNILCNDTGALVNPEFSADTKKIIRQALDVSLQPGMIADVETVGSVAVIRDGRCLLHRDASINDFTYIESLLNVKCYTGTVNLGNPYVKAGLFCNTNGFVIGKMSGGPEVSNVDESLGFIGES
ncbi:translation initiation factor IF-6 [Candidatus Woesearchaeota archaeon]|nr:translation initiation factor IF-6 [Candidatus Woesearchaeota archaeon]